jgi:hypothetical protein
MFMILTKDLRQKGLECYIYLSSTNCYITCRVDYPKNPRSQYLKNSDASRFTLNITKIWNMLLACIRYYFLVINVMFPFKMLTCSNSIKRMKFNDRVQSPGLKYTIHSFSIFRMIRKCQNI